MGAVQLPDELQRAIERQVAEGRATSTAAFLEEAVLRLIDDARLEDDVVRGAAQAGIADIAAGRYTMVATSVDGQRLQEHMMARLRASLSAKE
jgi:Arc/MetJ-type ribon-helix-helix transcriptional regulator